MSEAELLEQAHTAMAEMRFEDAVKICDRILRQNPQSVDAVYFKAQAMSNLQEYEVALRLLDQALRLVDGNSDYFANILLLKGNTLLELGLIAEAEVCYDQGLRIRPRLGRFWIEKSRAAARKGDFQASADYCDRALSIDRSDARAWNNKAFALLRLGELDNCIECFQQAVRLKPDYTAAWQRLGEAYEMKGDMRQAMECHKRVQEYGQQGMFFETKGHKPVDTSKHAKKWWKFWE